MIFRRHKRELDERISQAQQAAEESRRRLDEVREQVVRPLRSAADHNRFADMIRASLLEGNHW